PTVAAVLRPQNRAVGARAAGEIAVALVHRARRLDAHRAGRRGAGVAHVGRRAAFGAHAADALERAGAAVGRALAGAQEVGLTAGVWPGRGLSPALDEGEEQRDDPQGEHTPACGAAAADI